MNKAQLTEQLAERADIPKVRAATYINTLIDIITEELTRLGTNPDTGEDEPIGKVTISDFGTFTISERTGFPGHNPKTRSRIWVPKRRIPVFRAGKGLKEQLNAGLS